MKIKNIYIQSIEETKGLEYEIVIISDFFF